MTIDPYDLSGDWPRPRLEAWILFGICVANKPADITSRKLNEFLKIEEDLTPFQLVCKLSDDGVLAGTIKMFRFGQYTRITRAFREVVKLNLDDISVELLETVPGIGPKTARMILMYIQPDLEIAALDTHVLRWLRNKGYAAPKNTPSGKQYRRLELAFIAEAKKQGLTPKQLDEQIWLKYAAPKKQLSTP